MDQPGTSDSHQKQIGLGTRLLSLFAVWAIALIATAIGLERGPELAQMALLFPLGLMIPFAEFAQIHVGDPDRGLYILSAIGWFPYLALNTVLLLAQKRRVYFVVFSALCLLLFLNVVSCHELQQLSLKQ